MVIYRALYRPLFATNAGPGDFAVKEIKVNFKS